jgi:hypothetical protein
MTRHRELMRSTLISNILLMLLPACIPIPLTPGYWSRENIGEQVPAFIKTGQTTREEALVALGEPDGAAADERWMTWRSERYGGGALFLPVFPGHPRDYAVGAEDARRLIVTFDAKGLVSDTRYDAKSCPSHGFVTPETGLAGESSLCLDPTPP